MKRRAARKCNGLVLPLRRPNYSPNVSTDPLKLVAAIVTASRLDGAVLIGRGMVRDLPTHVVCLHYRHFLDAYATAGKSDTFGFFFFGRSVC